MNIQLKYRFIRFIKILLPLLYNAFFSITVLIGILFFCISYPSISDKINNNSNIENMFIAIGGILCAIFTLIISLAIIPIQRAIEIFSPTIRRNYIKDIYIQAILIVLGIFIFISFALTLADIKNIWKLFIQIEIIAVSLDLVRWHFRRISFLLEPYNAIKSLSSTVCSKITKTQQTIAKISYNELKKYPKDKRSLNLLKQIEKDVYKYIESNYNILLNNWIDELEDIVLKSVSRAERLTAKHGINNLVNIIISYIDSRKTNYQIYPIDLFAFGSDLDRFINPIYEKLLNTCRIAIHYKDEQSGVQVIRALSYIAQKTTELQGIHPNSAPLAGLPIAYLQKCSELCHKTELEEISWNIINELPIISEKSPKNTLITDVHTPVLNSLSSISQKYYLSPDQHIAKQAISNMCRVACHLIKENHYNFRTFLSLLTKELKTIIPFMLVNEKALDTNAYPPYSIVNDFSLGNIVLIASTHIKPIPDKKWVNPYNNFIELNKIIYMHFRNLAENTQYDIQRNFLSRNITETIKHISTVYLQIIKNKITDNFSHNNELINQIGWYQSFFWAVFNNKKEIDLDIAKEFSDATATIGLQFAHAEYYKVLDYSINDICSIAKDYVNKTVKPDRFGVADILICAWQLRYFSEHIGKTETVKKADDEIKKIIDLLLQKDIDINEEFNHRKQQLSSHLKEFEPHIIPISSQDYLKAFLKNDKKI